MSEYHSSNRYRSSGQSMDEDTDEMATFDDQIAIRNNSKSSTDQSDPIHTQKILVNLSTLSKGVISIYKKFDRSRLSILKAKLSIIRHNQDGLYDRYLNLSSVFNPKEFSNEELILVKDILVLAGFSTSDNELFYQNNPKEIFKRVMHAEKALSLFEYYHGSTSLKTMKENLPFCIQNEELDLRIQTVLKVCMSEDNDLINQIDFDGEGGISYESERIGLKGKFENVILDNIDFTTENLVRNSIQGLISGKNTIYLLSGQTSSGKTTSIFGTNNKKLDQSKQEKGIANQIFDILHEELPDNYSVSLVCQQIFNETVFDLLKKVIIVTPVYIKKEKELNSCESERTNFDWLRVSKNVNTISELQNKDSFQKLLKRIAKNRALLSLNGKFIERRSNLILRFILTRMDGTEQNSREFVILRLPSSEKLTPNELEEMKSLNMTNQIFSTFNNLRNLLTSGTLSPNPCAFLKLFHPRFLESAQFTIISHVKLNKESETETKHQLNFLRNFNSTVEVYEINNNVLVDTEFIGDVLSRYEDIESIALDESSKFRITQLHGLESSLSQSLKNIEKFSPGLTPFEFFSLNDRLSLQADKMHHLLKLLDCKRKELQIDTRLFENQKSSSNSRPSQGSSNSRYTLNSENKPEPTTTSEATSQKSNPFSKVVYQFLEQEVFNTKSSLSTEGRCPVCTLCVPCKHYESLQKLNLETKSTSVIPRRNPTPLAIARSVHEKSNRDRDTENFEPLKPMSTPHTNRRTVETKEPVSKSNIDSSRQTSESGSRNHSATPSFKIRTRRGNPLGELKNISNSENKDPSRPSSQERTILPHNPKAEKLINQLRLEEYQEKRVLDALNGMDEFKIIEELMKKDSEKNDSKRQRYYSEQRKKLEELKKKKESEAQAEAHENQMAQQKEKQKKKEMEKYYANLKKRVSEYKEKKKANDLSFLLEEKPDELNLSEDKKLINAFLLEKIYMPKSTPMKPITANGGHSHTNSAAKNLPEN